MRDGSKITHHPDGQIEIKTNTDAAARRVFEMTQEHRKLDYEHGRRNQDRAGSELEESLARNEEIRAKKRESRGVRRTSTRRSFTFSGGLPV